MQSILRTCKLIAQLMISVPIIIAIFIVLAPSLLLSEKVTFNVTRR